MCGRYSLFTSLDAVLRIFEIAQESPESPNTPWLARYNIAPTQRIPIVTVDHGQRILRFVRWGLVPNHYPSPTGGPLLINARAETIASKPSFRGAFHRQRCLIPADSFFEWQQQAHGRKQPYVVQCSGQSPIAFAGIWERWRRGANTIDSCAIVTTTASEPLSSLHSRMPVVFTSKQSFDTWLNPHSQEATLKAMLRPLDDALTELFPVGQGVNNANQDNAQCIEPLVRAPATPPKKPRQLKLF